MSKQITKSSMMKVINAGNTIETRSQMTDEYFNLLQNLLFKQADSELAGAYGYVPWICKAPTVKSKKIVSSIVDDEVRHAKVIYDLLANLGFDTESYVQEHETDFAWRMTEDIDLGTNTAKNDSRVNIFYYPIDTWMDFIMFNFTMDRGAGHQLHDTLTCSYGPWARAVKQIFEEEVTHIGHGTFWVKKFAQDSTTRDECQTTLNKWYLRTMNIFGNEQSKKNDIYCKYKLKHRANAQVRQAYVDEVKKICDPLGLVLPDWPTEPIKHREHRKSKVPE